MNSTPSIPQLFIDPISLEIMQNPVVDAAGHSFSESGIKHLIQGGNQFCPLGHERITLQSLKPNYSLRGVIEEWQKNQATLIPNSDNSSPRLIHATRESTSVITLRHPYLQMLMKLKAVHDESGADQP